MDAFFAWQIQRNKKKFKKKTINLSKSRYTNNNRLPLLVTSTVVCVHLNEKKFSEKYYDEFRILLYFYILYFCVRQNHFYWFLTLFAIFKVGLLLFGFFAPHCVHNSPYILYNSNTHLFSIFRKCLDCLHHISEFGVPYNESSMVQRYMFDSFFMQNICAYVIGSVSVLAWSWIIVSVSTTFQNVCLHIVYYY